MTAMINRQNGVLLEGLCGAEPMLYTQTVPRHLVHRTSSSEVFLTGLRVTGHNTFQVGAQWPGSHPFYGPRTGSSHDPLLFLECLRQAGLLIAHVAFEVPHDFQFVTHEKCYHVTPAGLRTDGQGPVNILIEVTAHDVRRRGKGFAGMLFEYRCYRDGRHVGSAAIRWSCVSAAAYARLRGERFGAVPPSTRRSHPVPPSLVGRRQEIDVLLDHTPKAAVWSLRLDPSHSVIFDHSIDHVPGMAAVEAARQAAALVLGQPDALPVQAEFSLNRYIEFDQPCQVYADPEPGSHPDAPSVRVAFEQDGRTAAAGTLQMFVSG